MRIRDLAQQDVSGRSVIEHHRRIELSVIENMVVEPRSDGRPVAIPLNLVIEWEKGALGILVAVRNLLELGLRPALPIELIEDDLPLSALTLLVEAPATPVTIPGGLTIARLHFITPEAHILAEAPELDFLLYPERLGALFLPE